MSRTAESQTAGDAKKASRNKVFFVKLSRSGKLVLGGLLLAAVIGLALFGPVLWKADPHAQDLLARFQAPTWSLGSDHPLGTDHLGRDVLARAISGARVSLLVGLGAAGIAAFIGIVVGVAGGYYGRWIDFTAMKVVEFFMALPYLLVAIAIMAVIGQGVWNLVLILGLTRWVGFSRQVRGEVLILKNREFVQAATAIGAGDGRIMVRHLLVNVLPSVLVVGTFTLASLILAEASLSFLGVGVPPSTPTWGMMLSEGRAYMSRAWWLSVIPGACIFATVLAVNLLGDGLRDHLDPNLKGRS